MLPRFNVVILVIICLRIMDDTGSPKKKLNNSDEKENEKNTDEHVATKNSTSLQAPITNPMLHPELWDLIFRNLVTDDFLRVINSCPEWNQLLNSRKTTELFSLALPFIMKFLPKNDFLTLRLVRQDWKRKCELIYDNHPTRLATATSDLQFPLLSSRGKMFASVDDGVKFESVQSFQRFTSEMGNNYGNPFPGRCVWLLIKELDDHNSEDYWKAVNQILLQFGEFIWYLRLDYLFVYNMMIETRLRNMLLQVPNLKRLRLTLGNPERSFAYATNEFNSRVIEFYRQNPPPKLENLEVFSCTTAHNGFEDFINELVKLYCPIDNLKSLNIPGTSYKPTLLPNLLELRTLICYFELPELYAASPKLESLSVIFEFERGVVYSRKYQCVDDYWDIYDDCENNIGVIFKGLQVFDDTLKELDLRPCSVTSNLKSRNFKVELPNLEKLYIAYSLPIHHLLELKSLKYLEIDESPIFRDKTYCSNIFEQLPKLHKVVHNNKKKIRVLIRPL